MKKVSSQNGEASSIHEGREIEPIMNAISETLRRRKEWDELVIFFFNKEYFFKFIHILRGLKGN